MAHLLIIEDDEITSRLVDHHLTAMGHQVKCTGSLSEGLSEASIDSFDIVFLDLLLPDGNGLSILPQLQQYPSKPEVIIMTATGNQEAAELAFRHGAWDYIKKPFSKEEVTLAVKRALQYRKEKLSETKSLPLEYNPVIGSSPAIKMCLDLVAKASTSDASILIKGETGTGKELFAHTIHRNSSRSDNNFVVVDCSVLPEGLVESILFGHIKGAFTGASEKRIGLIEEAMGGTLFLDEVGELPLSTQRAFLRLLQEGRFRSLGSNQEQYSDFRLIAASNRNLDQMAEQGHFRTDLLYRLRAVSIELPPLRQRRQDIADLTIHYIDELCKQKEMAIKSYVPEFIQAMMQYQWPGNVRELIQTLQHALTLAGEIPTLYPRFLPSDIRLLAVNEPTNVSASPIENPKPEVEHPQSKPLHFSLDFSNMQPLKEFRRQAIDQAESQYLKELMRLCRGSIIKARAISGLSESRLHALLKQHKTPRFRF